MTLSVDAFRVDADGTEHLLPVLPSIAGLESHRHSFYGGPQAFAMRLRVLP